MKKIKFLFLLVFIFLISSSSYSQRSDSLKYFNDFYQADLRISVKGIDSVENVKIQGLMGYGVKTGKYFIGLYISNANGCMFDILSNKLAIDVEIDNETLNYIVDSDHLAIDFSAFAFYVPASDLLKINYSKKVILKIVLMKGDNKSYKNIPVTIDLKPEKTDVFLDFYNLSANDKEKK